MIAFVVFGRAFHEHFCGVKRSIDHGSIQVNGFAVLEARWLCFFQNDSACFSVAIFHPEHRFPGVDDRIINDGLFANKCAGDLSFFTRSFESFCKPHRAARAGECSDKGSDQYRDKQQAHDVCPLHDNSVFFESNFASNCLSRASARHIQRPNPTRRIKATASTTSAFPLPKNHPSRGWL